MLHIYDISSLRVNFPAVKKLFEEPRLSKRYIWDQNILKFFRLMVLVLSVGGKLKKIYMSIFFIFINTW